jgi:hypothetical protein
MNVLLQRSYSLYLFTSEGRHLLCFTAVCNEVQVFDVSEENAKQGSKQETSCFSPICDLVPSTALKM